MPGTKSATDLKAIAEAFGSNVAPMLLKGGQGITFRAGVIVIKPADSIEEAAWLAMTFSQLQDTAEIRTPKPVPSINGNWIENGYVAWTYVEGKARAGADPDKSMACDAYHRLVSHIPKPDFLATRIDPWSVADRKAWGEEHPDYGHAFTPLYRDMLSSLKEISLPNQIIHGDFNGNVLLADKLPPAVIDFSPYWRPAAFAQAVILIDTAAWDKSATASGLLDVFGSTAHIEQLTLRATLRRIFEQFEQVRMRGLNAADGLQVAERYQSAYLRLFG
jgi:uncharacterized protein (TIGR02569 family)